MDTVKTTVVFPRKTWASFQKLTGKKRTSQVLSKLAESVVRWHAAQKLIHHQSDPTWDDSYLKDMFKKEVKALKQSLK